MMSRKIVGLLIAAGALLFLGDPAHATIAKHVARPTHKATATRRHAGPKPSLVIVTKTPNDAPDFDYRDRIQEAQQLIARQPVLKGDIQVDGLGKLTHFAWVLAVGQKTGPLTVLRMDEMGKNDQGFTVTWPVDNFINTKFHVEKP